MPSRAKIGHHHSRIVMPRCILALCTVAAVAMQGCHSYYGYRGPVGGPGYYGAPGYYGGYGQPYNQGPGYMGTPVLGAPSNQPGGAVDSPGSGGGNSPTPVNGPPETYDNGGPGGIRFEQPNNNAPPFNPNPSSGPGRVPDPSDELNNAKPEAAKPTLTPTSATAPAVLHNDLEQGAKPATSPQPADTTTEDDPFSMPKTLKNSNISKRAGIQTVSYEEPHLNKLNPFGRDTENANPSWLRGVIEYDQKNRAWTILYSTNPDARDPNGGVLTLANHPSLAKCRNGEVVLVEGAIDASTVDARGKSTYAIDSVTPLSTE